MAGWQMAKRANQPKEDGKLYSAWSSSNAIFYLIYKLLPLEKTRFLNFVLISNL